MASKNDRSLDLIEDSSLPNDPDIYIYSNLPKACHPASQEEIALVNHQMLHHTGMSLNKVSTNLLRRCLSVCNIPKFDSELFLGAGT